MKPIVQAIFAVVIAATFGTGGYFLGKGSSVSPAPAAEGLPRAASEAVAARRDSSPPFVSADLRAALDAEADPLARFNLALRSMDAWVEKAPLDALDWLASQPPSERRDEVLNMALNQFSETDAKSAADWAMQNLQGADLNNAVISIAENWAMQNGKEAADWFLARPPAELRDGALENILFAWASNEPAAALDYLQAHPETGALSSTLRQAALAGWAKSDPENAVNASLVLSRANNDPGQLANTLANWATIDLKASSQWLLANLEPGYERTVAAQELAVIFARQSPDSGVAWLEQLSPGTEKDAAASALVAAWARNGPAEAARWVSNQKSINVSPRAVTAIAEGYLVNDPAGFEAWKNSLPEGPLKARVSETGIPVPAGDDE